ncbi:MAG TPA: extracellular solute-binding protein [Acidimicrobiales bacterium]|nr:extracellular solute-binding protein [Acidimicrobiales bacterium]
MTEARLRVALVGGPMYDALYEPFIDDVEVVVHADHPTLNREVAAMLAAGERIDVLSTHGKYAPSQSPWLRPLDDLVDTSALAPKAVELCSYRGSVLCAPRNIDVRTLWWRTDRMGAPPATWNDLLDGDAVFGFTGRESGLFGLFFELVTGLGGALFDGDVRPTMTTPIAEDAVATIVQLAARGPADLPEWHYDQVDAALLDGRVDCVAAWPGGYDAIAASPLYGELRPAMYPGGVSYSGCHAWAIPTTCGDVAHAAAFVQDLCSAATHARESGIPANVEALATRTPRDAVDAARLAVTQETIATAMITYPHIEGFDAIEDAGWQAINAALRGEISPTEATQRMQIAAERVLG